MTKLQQLSQRIADLQVQFLEEKARLRKLAPGQHGDATVYRVRRTTVKTYTRRAYTAVRVRKLWGQP